jgi:acyl-CoA synthetase (NDP forming)
VAVKSGRYSKPTAALAQSASAIDEVSVRALFEQAGVIRVETLADLFDVAQLLAYQPLPSGPRVAVVGNSSALGLLASDALLGEGLELVGDAVDVGVAAPPEEFAAAVAKAMGDERVDALVAVFVPPVAIPGASYARALREAVAGERKPVVAVFLAVEGVPAELAVASQDGMPGPGSVPSYPGPERAAAALARVSRYARWRARPVGEFVIPAGIEPERACELVQRLGAASPQTLADADVLELLACYSIEVGPSEATGVSCVLEIVDDPSFGSLLSFGLSGMATELLGDRAYRVVPVSDQDAAALVRAPRAAPLLAGYGGTEPTRLDALEELVLRVGRIADDLPQVRSLSLDPVLASSEGVFVTGARVVLGPPPNRGDTGPRRLR